MTRLYQHLARALRDARPAGFNAPVTIAEIYQELVPYRAVRGDVGFAMNADYEDALLRLLSGDGGHVRLDPANAADAMRRELQSPNPNVAMYREYAACDAWINPPDDEYMHGHAAAAPAAAGLAAGSAAGSAADSAAGSAAGSGTGDADDWDAFAALNEDGPVEAAAAPPHISTFALAEDDEADEDADAAPGAAMPAAPVAPAAPAAAASAASSVAPPAPAAAARGGATPVGAPCVFCDSPLPVNRAVRFCPYCGADQTLRPCGGCGEVLEPGWLFCVACGASADGAA